MPKIICICILLIYFKVISKKGGHCCPRLLYIKNKSLMAAIGFHNGRWRYKVENVSSASVDLKKCMFRH